MSLPATRCSARTRPFKCTQCDKDFTRKAILQEHSRTHTGEKPEVCKKCGEGFTRKHDAQRHEKTCGSATKALSKCDHCNKGFSRRSALNKHYSFGCSLRNVEVDTGSESPQTWGNQPGENQILPQVPLPFFEDTRDVFKFSLNWHQLHLLAPPAASIALDYPRLGLLNQNNKYPLSSSKMLPGSISMTDSGFEFKCASCFQGKGTQIEIWNHVIDHATQFKHLLDTDLSNAECCYRACIQKYKSSSCWNDSKARRYSCKFGCADDFITQSNLRSHYFGNISHCRPLKNMMRTVGRSLIVSLLVLSFGTRDLCFEWFRSLRYIRDRSQFFREVRSEGQSQFKNRDDWAKTLHEDQIRADIIYHQYDDQTKYKSSHAYGSVEPITTVKFSSDSYAQHEKDLEHPIATTKHVPEKIVDIIGFCFDDTDGFVDELWNLRDQTEKQVDEFERLAGASHTLYCIPGYFELF